MKALFYFSRIFTGIVFTFSGFTKAVDPVGTQIKFDEYFEAMGMDFLMPYAMIFSFLMNAAEFVIGLMLIFNVFTKLSSWAAFIFLLLFTPLTLWLAIAEPVSDCGCFGDALPLTNWQTFGKNLFFLAVVIFLLLSLKKYYSPQTFKRSFIITAVFAIAVFAFEFYNYYNLPLVDFRPFKVGADIKKGTEIPEDAEQDVYETKLFYKNLNTGESQEFSIETIPYEDTLNWAYDTTITKLISKGYEPPINDFYLTGLDGVDRTEDILNNEETSFILIMHRMDEAFDKVKNVLPTLADFADENQLRFWCFTSSESSVIEEYFDKLPKNIELCTGDYKMLKTMVRSDPGFIIFKNAVIIEKYHYRNIPDIHKLKSKL